MYIIYQYESDFFPFVQVRYIYEVFKKMQKKILPGLSVLCLHGHMKQTRRMSVYENFTNKKHAILLATDVAARGLGELRFF